MIYFGELFEWMNECRNKININKEKEKQKKLCMNKWMNENTLEWIGHTKICLIINSERFLVMAVCIVIRSWKMNALGWSFIHFALANNRTLNSLYLICMPTTMNTGWGT